MRPVRRAARWSVALWLLPAAACGRDAGVGARDESARAEAVFSPPPPPPPAAPSRFDLPLRYDFTPVLEAVERAVPRTFGSLDSVRAIRGDDRRKYAFEATRGRFTAFARDSLVHLRTTLSYAARGYYKPPIGPTLSAGCGGDERPEIAVEVVTPLTLDSTWHLRSRARLAHLAPVSERDEDRCRVSIIRLDVTDRVVEAARRALTARMPQIDRLVSRIDLTERATGWWALLERPIRLADEVWLELRPQRLRVGRVSGDGRVLTVDAGLDALPRVVLGARPVVTPSALPPLARDTAGDGFRIVLDGEVDWATASRTITESLRGRRLERMGQSVTVTSAIASPAGDGRLALLVGFTGDATGTLRLVGRPRLDATRTAIVVPDLDYDLDTDDGLVRMVAWVKGDELRELLRARASVPVAPVLERGRTMLARGLNRTIGGVLAIATEVEAVSVDGLFVTPTGLLVRAGATGASSAVVRRGTAKNGGTRTGAAR